MEDDHDNHFEQTTSGASETFPMQCSALRKNGHVMIKGRPCKIVEMTTSKTGKHGHAKVHLVGIDIFNSKKYEDLCPSTHNIDVPNVNRADFTLVSIDDGFLALMDDKGDVREDLRIPNDEELAKKIQEDYDAGNNLIITVLKAVGEEAVIACKNANN